MPEFKNLKELLHKFKDEDVCREYLVRQRWNGKPICPYCCCPKAYVIEGGKRYKCADKNCYKKFSVTVGTVFENSNIPLSTWFASLYLISAHKKGISSLQLSRDLGITQKTAWFILHRIREGLREKHSTLLVDEVQVDETYMGGKFVNKSEKKQAEQKIKGVKAKTPVVGIMQTGGKIITHVVKNANQETTTPLLLNSVDKNAILVTDSSSIYTTVGKNFKKHVVVSHSTGVFVKRGFHINGLENYWSMLKRGVYGIYHQVSPKHLHRYCDEFAYRYNSRRIPDNLRFEISLAKLGGRLKYAELIANHE
jgi:transposase-like protein